MCLGWLELITKVKIVSFIQNLRIGTKLAVSSLLSILLVAAMVWVQVSGSASTREANELVAAQSNIVRDALSAKVAVRDMQVTVRDMRLARTATEIQASFRRLEERHKSIDELANEIGGLTKVPEERESIERVRVLAQAYVGIANDISAVRTEITATQQKRGAGGELPADLTSRYAALEEKEFRLVRESGHASTSDSGMRNTRWGTSGCS